MKYSRCDRKRRLQGAPLRESGSSALAAGQAFLAASLLGEAPVRRWPDSSSGRLRRALSWKAPPRPVPPSPPPYTSPGACRGPMATYLQATPESLPVKCGDGGDTEQTYALLSTRWFGGDGSGLPQRLTPAPPAARDKPSKPHPSARGLSSPAFQRATQTPKPRPLSPRDRFARTTRQTASRADLRTYLPLFPPPSRFSQPHSAERPSSSSLQANRVRHVVIPYSLTHRSIGQWKTSSRPPLHIPAFSKNGETPRHVPDFTATQCLSRVHSPSRGHAPKLRPRFWTGVGASALSWGGNFVFVGLP